MSLDPSRIPPLLRRLRAAGLGPRDRGAPHDPYFATLNAELRAHAPGQPLLVLDLDRLDHNCARLRATLPSKLAFRIVAKSLPCPDLLAHVMRRFDTHRLMVFHGPHIVSLAEALPQADLLLGKPLPAAAAQVALKALSGRPFDATRQLQWLIDTPERLEQYHQLARALGTKLRCNLEIDIGLHRGGFEGPPALIAALDRISAHPEHLELAGFMGYDVHVGKLPDLRFVREAAFERARARYQACIDLVHRRYPALATRPLTLNGAGSPTLRLHDERSPLNEVAAGSCLVLPADFEMPLLADLLPAAFIATPVLKVIDGFPIPELDALGQLVAAVDPNRERTHFIYGGGWRARCVSPRGLSDQSVFGFSANQAALIGSRRTGLSVDDYVFLQPRQSEGMLLSFGDIATIRAGKLMDRWSPLPA